MTKRSATPPSPSEMADFLTDVKKAHGDGATPSPHARLRALFEALSRRNKDVDEYDWENMTEEERGHFSAAIDEVFPVSETGEPTLKEMQAMYDAQCACTDEWKAKYDAEKEKKASETLLNRIAELKSQLAEVNQRLAAANEKLLAPSATRRTVPALSDEQLCEIYNRGSGKHLNGSERGQFGGTHIAGLREVLEEGWPK